MASKDSRDNLDLDVAWEQACASFSRTTGINLKTAAPSPEQVISLFNTRKAKDEKAHRKLNAVKDVAQKTLTIVMRVGDIAAQAASMVFGPASLCMNAVSFFVQAGVEYRGIYEGLDKLFSRIFEVLERFQIYQENKNLLPKEMIKIANEILLCFVRICELSFKVLQGNKLWKYVKAAAFSDDAGVQAEIDALCRLEERESQMKGTLNLVSAKNTEKNIQSGFAATAEGIEDLKGTTSKAYDAVRKLENESDNQKLENRVRKALGQTNDNYKDDYRAYLSSLMRGTGSWLQRNPAYQKWSSAEPGQSLLYLSAEEGYGKTYTMSAMVADLQKRFPQGRETAARVSVAYFYIKKDAKSASNSSGRDERSRQSEEVSLDRILRTLAWQIAQNDPFYRRDLASILEHSSDTGNVEEIWSRLFASHSKSDATFFLLLDGVSDLHEKYEIPLRKLVESFVAQPQSALRIKLMLSARPRFFTSLPSKPKSVVETIDLGSQNREDVAMYIKMKVDDMDIFKSQSQQVQDLKKEVCEKLTDSVNGDFVEASWILKTISEKQRPNEIREVLEKTKKFNRTDAIGDEIERCNHSLNPEVIKDLNTLLFWVMYARRPLNLSELKSIIYTRRQESSLRPLYQQIKEKFSSFFTVRLDRDAPFSVVALTSESIADYFKHPSEGQELSTLPAQSDATEPEVRLVKNFLRTFCEDNLYQRLGFEKFLNSKLAANDTTVHVDCESADAVAVLECLKVLTREYNDDEETAPFMDYASWHFYEHLEAVDLALTSPKLKAEIGNRLIRIFWDVATIEQLEYATRFWFFREVVSKHVPRWFQDSAVVKNLTEEQKGWCLKISEDSDEEVNLFTPTAQAVARNWVHSRKMWDITNNAMWILAYVTNIHHKADPEAVSFLDWLPRSQEASIENIYEVATWIQDHVDLSELKFEMTRNLGITFYSSNHFEEARNHFYQAAGLKADDLDITHYLALTYADMKKYEIGIATMEPVITALQNNEDVLGTGTPLSDAENLQLRVAAWMRELHRFDDAKKMYDDMVSSNPRNYSAASACIYLLSEIERYSEALETLEKMQNETVDEVGCDRLSELFRDQAAIESYHLALFKIGKNTNQIERIKFHYQKALKTCDSKLNSADNGGWTTQCRISLMSYYASMLYQQTEALEEKEQAIKIWEEIVDSPLVADSSRESWVIGEFKQSAVQKLSRAYMEKAAANRANPELVSQMIKKVQDFGSDPGDGNSSILDPVESRRILGLYYSRIGDLEKAKAELKPDIEVAVELLSDEDASNDWRGYLKLASVFAAFGDSEAAVAAWCMCQPTEGLARFRKQSPDSPEPTTTGSPSNNGTKDDDIHLGLKRPAITKNALAEAEVLKYLTTVSNKVEVVETAAPRAAETVGLARFQKQNPASPESTTTGSPSNNGTKDDDTQLGLKHPRIIEDAPAESTELQYFTTVINRAVESAAPRAAESVEIAQYNSGDVVQPNFFPSLPKIGATEGIGTKLVGPFRQYCDGHCGTHWSFADDFYVCQDCKDVQLDAPCLEKLRQGKLSPQTCGKNHKFLYIPPLDPKQVERVQEGKVRLKGEEVPVEEWVKRIRAEWKLESAS